MYQLIKKDKSTQARLGEVTTAHGKIKTPFFMPVGTNATVKCLNFDDLLTCKAQIVLSNTYHLVLRPGIDTLEKAGGLHQFMSWEGPILTDSGGYQVFSLSKLRKLNDDGVIFQSHIDGSEHVFTPESVVGFQRVFGSDIMMPLDECVHFPCTKEEAEDALRRTTLWAKRAKKEFERVCGKNCKQHLFGIVQGSTYKDLRERSAQEILEIGFDGYAVGGVSVGEPIDAMFRISEWVTPHLPEDKPRYLMGMGLPDQIVESVAHGIDMFDTCLPTRCGRHGTAFTREGKLMLRNAAYKEDFSPIDSSCTCFVCQKYTRSYIRHLANLKEITGLSLISYHNVYFYVSLMKEIREAIENNCFEAFKDEFVGRYRHGTVTKV